MLFFFLLRHKYYLFFYNIDDNIYNILHDIIDYDLFRYELFDV